MKVGFIGYGNMGSAIVNRVIEENIVDTKELYISDLNKDKTIDIRQKYDINIFVDNMELIKNNLDILFLCVKPQNLEETINSIKNIINDNVLIVSIVAGKSIDYIEKLFEKKIKIVRVMPNTPALIGEGISAICTNELANNEENNKTYDLVLKIISSIGDVFNVEEKYFDIITQISGASPAFIFMVIEAMVDGAVLCGMPRDMAYKFASKAVKGSGALAYEKKCNPGILKDMVTSPSGTTIEGVKVLEENAVRGAFMNAIIESYKKSKNL